MSAWNDTPDDVEVKALVAVNRDGRAIEVRREVRVHLSPRLLATPAWRRWASALALSADQWASLVVDGYQAFLRQIGTWLYRPIVERRLPLVRDRLRVHVGGDAARGAYLLRRYLELGAIGSLAADGSRRYKVLLALLASRASQPGP